MSLIFPKLPRFWTFGLGSSRYVIFLFISGDALFALKISLNASAHQLTDWNQNQVNPCTWSRVYCDSNNNVIQV